jgi:L-arabinose isomerase
MREVAVTEGDKVAAQIQLGYSVNGHGIGDLVRSMNAVGEAQATNSSPNTKPLHHPRVNRERPELRRSLEEAARIELGLRAFLPRAVSRDSRIPLRTCMGCRNCPESRPND